jgi:hypothetical protein
MDGCRKSFLLWLGNLEEMMIKLISWVALPMPSGEGGAESEQQGEENEERGEEGGSGDARSVHMR